MKRLLLPLLAALALPTAVQAQVDPEVHNLCKDVADYSGCVKSNSKSSNWNPFKSIPWSTKIKETKFARTFCNDKSVHKDSEYIKKCITYLSPYKDSLETIESYVINYCLPDPASDEDKPIQETVDNLQWCLVKFGNVKLPSSFPFERITTNWSGAIDSQGKKRMTTMNDLTTTFSPKTKIQRVVAPVQKRSRDYIYHKGKTYTASRVCPEGEVMRWSLTDGNLFKKARATELGCMTDKENEQYWRDYKLGRSTRTTGGGSGSSDKFFLEQKIHSQKMLNNYNRNINNYRNNMGY